LPPTYRRLAGWLLATAGLAAGLALLPLAWPAFDAWQPQVGSQIRVDGAGQTLVLEHDNPLALQLAVSPGPDERGQPPVTARVSIRRPSFTTSHQTEAVLVNQAGSWQLDLSHLPAEAGSIVQIELIDPSGAAWAGSTEHDSYPWGERLSQGHPVGGDLAFRVYYRRSPGSLAVEGLVQAMEHWGLVLAAALAVGSAGLLASGLLRDWMDLSLGAWLSLGLGAGLLTISAAGWLAGILRVALIPSWQIPLALGMLLIGGWCWRGRPDTPLKGRSAAIVFVVWLLVMGLLYLAFGAELSLPPHIDSVENYAIVADLVTPSGPQLAANQIGQLASSYYHYGYHALAAWLMSLAGGPNPQSLVPLGQLIQLAAVASLYFPIYVMTKDDRLALIGVILAGMGWSMPAYASNWAKYPALLGLSVLPTVVGLMLLAVKSDGTQRRRLVVASGAAGLVATISHTRIAFILLGIGAAWLIARQLVRTWRGGRRPVAIGALALACVASLFMLSAAGPERLESARAALAFVTRDQGAVTSLLVLLVLPLAAANYPTLALVGVGWIFGLIGLHFVPPGAGYPFPLLDGPMVSMALYQPLALLGALGSGGLLARAPRWFERQRHRPWLLAGVLGVSLAYLGWGLAARDWAPGNCCLIPTNDDLELITYVQDHLPQDARILVPAALPPDARLKPFDAGAWLGPLTGRTVVPALGETDLGGRLQHELLCTSGVTHIYVGSTPNSFRRETLELAAGSYRPLLRLPSAALYEISGCPFR
jgi:hypothetical protein